MDTRLTLRHVLKSKNCFYSVPTVWPFRNHGFGQIWLGLAWPRGCTDEITVHEAESKAEAVDLKRATMYLKIVFQCHDGGRVTIDSVQVLMGSDPFIGQFDPKLVSDEPRKYQTDGDSFKSFIF